MCDLFCVLGPGTASGRTLWAKNSDRPPDEPQVVEWFGPRTAVPGRDTRTTWINIDDAGETLGFVGSRPTWMWGVEHGVNTAGVAIGNATIYTTLDPRPFPPALTGMDLVRLGLERSASAADAVTTITGLIERYGQGGSGHRDGDRPYWSSFLIADEGQAFVLETSGPTWAVETVTDRWAISNRTTIPTFDESHRHPRQPVAQLVDPRLDATRALLDRPGPLTVEACQAHLRSHFGGADGWTVCMHVDGVEATMASIVAELPDDGSPPVAHVLLGSPCESDYVRIEVSDRPGPEQVVRLLG